MAENDSRMGGWEAPRWLRTGLLVLLGVGVLVALVWALQPQPVGVDLAEVSRGPLEISVDEDGRAQVRDRFVVAAPVSGTLRRVEVQAGDRVERGDVLFRVAPPEPGIPDERSRTQLEAQLAAARAGLEGAMALAEAAEAGVVEARLEVRRQEVLLQAGGGSEAALERARAFLQAREAESRAAGFRVQGAEGEVENLRLALTLPGGGNGEGVVVRAPIAGSVLRVQRESGGPVGVGEPVLEVGDPSALEVVVDLLSPDAVRVPAGAEARITGWGGDAVLEARVRAVEPSAFTRISALGLEEQRVNVLLDPVGEGWGALGDGFRVEARLILERDDDVLRVPSGALFRIGGGWAAFRMDDGEVTQVEVRVGRRSPEATEVLAGLEEGDRVVLYPGDRVVDGVRVRER